MEGPSLVLAAEDFSRFVGKKITKASGTAKIEIERITGRKILDIFSYAKYLNIQFDEFAVRIHFLMYGSYRINRNRKEMLPRLTLATTSDFAHFYNCSIKILDGPNIKSSYDFRVDIMSPVWDPKHVASLMAHDKNRLVADVLMDQEIFAGVGNIIKNEVLFNIRLHPDTQLHDLTKEDVKRLLLEARSFSKKFYELRKIYSLTKNLRIYRKSICPHCGGRVTRKMTGVGKRISFYCETCQIKK